MQEYRIAYQDGRYVLFGQQQSIVLEVGDWLELCIGERWQVVRVCSGGYCGWYYETADGRRGRFAVSQQAQGYVAGHVFSLQELAQSLVGKSIGTRVALAAGPVVGVVQEVTRQQQVRFTYQPRANGVTVSALVPLDRLAAVFDLSSLAAIQRAQLPV
jgi:hypothetical protein